MCMLSRFSRVRLYVTLWPAAYQAPLSMGFSRQEYWCGFPGPSPEDLLDPGIESPISPALRGVFFTTSAAWKAPASSGRPVNTQISGLHLELVFLKFYIGI